MKNIRKNTVIYIICAVIIAVLLSVIIYSFAIKPSQSNTPPLISLENNNNVFSSQADEKDFLEGISAVDKEDGDVTSSLVVESVVDKDENGTKIITYSVTDSDSNTTKFEREITIKD